jgi:exonuclease SbcD
LKLVHLSDLHLGFRQYQRLTPRGINQREADVAGTFRRAIDLTIALRPDVVLVGGDVFHTVRPTNPAILQAFKQFTRLVSALPQSHVVMVAGNHDAPKTSETGCILRLFAELDRVHVVDYEAQRVPIPELGLSVLAVPDTDAARHVELAPDPDARRNVLLLHGEVEGVLPRHVAQADRAALEISAERIGAARWDYVALGHYHVYREVAPNCYYSGSLDYTSANSWGELVEERQARLPGKGLIERDLETGAHRFHHVPPARALVDLEPVSARGLSAPEVDAAIREAIDSVPGGIDDRIVRLVVRDVPRHIVRELDHKALREYKRRALHFHLDPRKPEIVRPLSVSGAPGRRPSLAETVRTQLETRLVASDVDRGALVELGLHYLREAEAVVAALPAPAAAMSAEIATEAFPE